MTLRIIGIIGLIVLIFLGFGEGRDTSLGVLLSLLLFGIGSIVLLQRESCEELKKLNAIFRTLNSKFDHKPGLLEPDPKPEIKKKVKGPGLVDRLLKNLENRRPPP